MALDASTYLSHLKAYVNQEYVVHDGSDGTVVLTEKYFREGDKKPRVRRIELRLPGSGIAFKLDHDEFESQRGKIKPALFHFLDDTAKPWSKRCDFVVFYVNRKCFHADCIEFKSKSLAADKIVPQLRAGVCWVRSLKRTIEHYTGDSRTIRVRKFAFGDNANPAPYVDKNFQLCADPSVRYCRFDDVNGQLLSDLSNCSSQEI
jgi:hypothetical protein